MKTLKNYTIIFDNACPMCRAYSSAFIKTKMLDDKGREAYQQMSRETAAVIDKDEARNGIALVNKETGEVVYGIDSIFKILANAFPIFAPILNFKPFRWVMKRVYALISFNRKVIVPGNSKADTCVPDFNLKYRWTYLILAWLLTSLVLTHYSYHLIGLLPPSRFFREFIICGGQIVFQSGVIFLLAKNKILDYLGNMMTVSLEGAILLFLFLLGGKISGLHNPYIYAGFFMLVVGLMLLDHFRRVKLLGIHWSASAGWVIYRLLVLWIII
jgi:predicted DCC family thiol-disulfide oxidoreductase YuxK